MLENRRYKRFDVSKEKIAVQAYDVTGFTFLGYISDISQGGLNFKTNTPLRWKEGEPMTVYLTMPNETKMTAMDIRPIRSKRKLFHSYHAGEFIGSVVTTDPIAPLLELKAEAELVGSI